MLPVLCFNAQELYDERKRIFVW